MARVSEGDEWQLTREGVQSLIVLLRCVCLSQHLTFRGAQPGKWPARRGSSCGRPRGEWLEVPTGRSSETAQ
eukprot:2777290-Lingulodinium_polyedra.AAC.1